MSEKARKHLRKTQGGADLPPTSEQAASPVAGSQMSERAGVPAEPMRRAKLGLVLAAGCLALGFVIAEAYDRFVTQPRIAFQALEVQRADVPAPEVPLLGRDGKPFSFSQHRGAVLFVNFWATWCPPCLEEMPSMLQLGRDLARAYPGKFRMIAVSEDEGWPQVDTYFTKTFGGAPSEVTIALDQDGKCARAYYCGARGSCPDIKFPETYIVDKSGRVVAYFVNGRDWTDPAARKFLERLIRG
jgi:thiol-disulfide isomerase/thioredoxin